MNLDRAMLVFIALCAASSTALLLVGESSPQVSEPIESTADLASTELTERLDRVIANLERIAGATESADSSRSPATDENTEENEGTDVAIARLESALRELMDRGAFDAKLDAKPPVETPTNLVEVDGLVSRMNSGIDRPGAQYFAWSPRSIYSKFGLPKSVVTSGPNRVDWYYEGSDAKPVRIVFVDGYVFDVKSR